MNNSSVLGLMVLVFLCTVTGASQSTEVLSDVYNELEQLRKHIRLLSKQVMMQLNYIEERIRTDGYSGVKVVRSAAVGLKNYNSASHLQPSAFGVHDHPEYHRTIGLGEFVAVMNGVEFRTRHNDYKLVMPSSVSTEYHAVEDISFPEVPQEVLGKQTVEEQTQEMRAWFEAFKKQDSSVRDYTRYFIPIMCYLEGAWTSSTEFSEPFPSERHKVDAETWAELHDKALLASLTGTRHLEGNLAFLPTTIMGINGVTGIPVYAQWNYRILCVPAGFDIPLAHFHQVDDLSYRMSTGMSIPQVAHSTSARYKLFDGKRNFSFRLLDAIFSNTPGKDNYGSDLRLRVFGEDIFSIGSSRHLNTAFYSRGYKMSEKGASGTVVSPLGFNDENMWMSMNTQPQVAPLEAEQCLNIRVRPKKYKLQCANTDIRLSYAIPLEIIYLTPLLTWNPYNLKYNTEPNITVQGARDGRSESSAFNGVDSSHFYMTPVEFLTGPLDNDSYERNFVYVTNPKGIAKKVVASGTRVIFQDIYGLGSVRLRYPIAPVHGEGSSVWKELNALKDIIEGTTKGPPTSIMFQMSAAVIHPLGEHTHDLSLNYDEFLILIGGATVTTVTREAQGHTHELVMSHSKSDSFRYELCDGFALCPDGHARQISLETHNTYTQLSAR